MSSKELKKSIGKIVIRISNEVIELQREYKKVNYGGFLSGKGSLLENSVNEKKNKLGLSWAKLSSSCVKLIRSYDMLSC